MRCLRSEQSFKQSNANGAHPMTARFSEEESCPLPCLWNGTQMCVQHLLSQECLCSHHINCGLACGLRHIYHPHGLPPCITASGEIRIVGNEPPLRVLSGD